MKRINYVKLLCAAVLMVSAGYGCSDNEQQPNDKSANRPADTEIGKTPDTEPSLLSPETDSGSDISAIREDDSVEVGEAQPESDVDDETAIGTQAEQFRKTKDAETRVQILEEVGNINADDLAAVALFSEALQDKNSEVRLAAVSELSTSEAQSAVDGLIAALHDSNSEVVLMAIDVLTSKNDSRIPGVLSSLLTHKNQEVREAASEAIDSLQEE